MLNLLIYCVLNLENIALTERKNFNLVLTIKLFNTCNNYVCTEALKTIFYYYKCKIYLQIKAKRQFFSEIEI